MAIVPGGDQDEITEEFSQIKQRDMDKDGTLKIFGKDEVREAIGLTGYRRHLHYAHDVRADEGCHGRDL
jgi:hypothetical protein